MAKTDMGLRLELFVRDMEVSIDFYRRVLGFAVLRRDAGYASLRQGAVTLGLGPIAKLSDEHGYFTRRRLAQERGLGIEIVLEIDDIQAYNRDVRASAHPITEDLQEHPWGLIDFRIVDPDGYYLRITARNPTGGG